MFPSNVNQGENFASPAHVPKMETSHRLGLRIRAAKSARRTWTIRTSASSWRLTSRAAGAPEIVERIWLGLFFSPGVGDVGDKYIGLRRCRDSTNKATPDHHGTNKSLQLAEFVSETWGPLKATFWVESAGQLGDFLGAPGGLQGHLTP